MIARFDYISDDSLRFFCSSIGWSPEESVLISEDADGCRTGPKMEVFAQAGLGKHSASF